MRLVKLGLASVNATVGAVDANVARALLQAQRMADAGVTVAAYPEQVLGGYPPEDLVQWRGFVEKQWTALTHFAEETASHACVHVLGVTVGVGGLLYNCAAVVAGGRIRGLVPKEKLPTYNVFYEGRTFAQGEPGMHTLHRGVPLGDLLFRFDFGVLGVEVCEDLWSPQGPLARRTYSGAELVLNLSASPYRVGIVETRRELVATRSADRQCTLAYVNAVGANDGLIFDGGGYVFQNGRSYLEAPRFREDFAESTVDLDRTLRIRAEDSTWRTDRARWLEVEPEVPVIDVAQEGFVTRREGLRYPAPKHGSFFLPAPEQRPDVRTTMCEDLLEAMSWGIGDYYEKTGAFRGLGIALSGGRDSLLTLLIAHRYAKRVRPEDPGSLIHAFYMPSRFSSEGTRQAAETICRDLGVPFQVISIAEAHEREREATRQMLGGGELTDLTDQNIQARLRAQRMWNWSNTSGGLFLQTGNMSEKSVGYTTIGGDLTGALAVIANVPKTVVMYLLDYLQETTGYEGIGQVLARPAGPELAEDQVGEEELMPFPVLDACFYLFAGEKLQPEEISPVLAQMFPQVEVPQLEAWTQRFATLFLRSIYKWVQSPLSLHVGNLDLERERAMQLPVVTRAEWLKG